MEKIHENVACFVLSCKLYYMKVQKHARFHVRYFNISSPVLNCKGSTKAVLLWWWDSPLFLIDFLQLTHEGHGLLGVVFEPHPQCKGRGVLHGTCRARDLLHQERGEGRGESVARSLPQPGKRDRCKKVQKRR